MTMRVRSILTALLGVVGFIVFFVIAVQTRLGQRVEQNVLDSSYYSERSPLLALVTVPNLAIAFVIVVGIACLRRAWTDAVVAAAVMGLSNVLGQLLKHRLLERPDFFAIDSVNTFPSGHTIAFASILFALLIALPPLGRDIVTPLAAALLATVCTQLVVFGWHRPSDIVGGVLLVLAVCGGVNAMRPAGGSHKKTGGRAASFRRAGAVVSAVIGVAGLTALAIGLIVGALHVLGPLDGVGWSVTVVACGMVIGGALVGTSLVGWALTARKSG
ncbi:phosphatase PAP2 family protein [Paramicrobacterium sp. CJ85]|uniref:phosphatase PAP2 family protein n=1 Tax=Paramicrobacterium sp. CJ85 TaxID=3445355 RepID=UPI003F63F06B